MTAPDATPLPTSRVPLLLDVDTGIDDSLALLYACASPEAELVAVTCVGGQRRRPAGRREHARRAGAGRPRRRRGRPRARDAARPPARDHAGDARAARDRVRRPAAGRVGRSRRATRADLIVEEARRRPGELTLVTLGPLTNLAVAVLREPALPLLLRRWVLMGGSYRSPGNTAPTTEWNVAVDPDAAKVVHRRLRRSRRSWSGGGRPGCRRLPLALGLDVTERAKLLPDAPRRRSRGAPARGRTRPGDEAAGSVATHAVVRYVADALRFYMEFHSRYDGFYGAFIHDPLAVAAALDPALVRTEAVAVDVELGGTLTTGETVADWRRDLGPAADPGRGGGGGRRGLLRAVRRAGRGAGGADRPRLTAVGRRAARAGVRTADGAAGAATIERAIWRRTRRPGARAAPRRTRVDWIRRQFDTRTIVLIPIAIAINIVLGQTVAGGPEGADLPRLDRHDLRRRRRRARPRHAHRPPDEPHLDVRPACPVQLASTPRRSRSSRSRSASSPASSDASAGSGAARTRRWPQLAGRLRRGRRASSPSRSSTASCPFYTDGTLTFFGDQTDVSPIFVGLSLGRGGAPRRSPSSASSILLLARRDLGVAFVVGRRRDHRRRLGDHLGPDRGDRLRRRHRLGHRPPRRRLPAGRLGPPDGRPPAGPPLRPDRQDADVLHRLPAPPGAVAAVRRPLPAGRAGASGWRAHRRSLRLRATRSSSRASSPPRHRRTTG